LFPEAVVSSIVPCRNNDDDTGLPSGFDSLTKGILRVAFVNGSVANEFD